MSIWPFGFSAIALALAGCGTGTGGHASVPSVDPKDRPVLEFGMRYAAALAARDWDAAFGMGSAEARSQLSADSIRAWVEKSATRAEVATDRLAVQFAEILPKPADPLEAREAYGITTSPPLESWRGMFRAVLGPEGSPSGFELRILVVIEAGALRAGFVGFQ